ncbi:PREDICTED: gustatory receptor for sugar taste 64e-like [Acromyrmex echinatior]|uniref:gustatory receptor for sugar taste 64e-like n=1 Tax=Acromyrmex echinatior TaxID=103372 RepID=UPI000580BBDC|nr:PREDICTED: gustatory receptor for sugar taste 64e-like [Acromyrmex echinatior]
MRQKKDKVKKMETQFSSNSQPPVPNPPRSRPFLNEQTLSISSNDPESFHCVMGPVLVMAQLFGILPVSGILMPSPLQIEFVKFSVRTIYSVFISGMVLFMATLSIIHMIKTLDSTTFEVQEGIVAATSGAIFYVNCVMGLIIFFWLSSRWVNLQRDWRSMELFIDSNKMERPKLRWKLYLIAASILFVALIEHILSILVHVKKYDWSGKSDNATFLNFLEIYCMSSHAFILEILLKNFGYFKTLEFLFSVKYNLALGIFIFIVSKLATFTWNFTDIFIAMVATGLAERYKTLNKYVISSISKHRPIDWSELREDYAVLSFMVKKVDNDISPIIFLSFVNNLYFICLQLLKGLSKSNNGIISDIYFFESFLFLIGRTMIVTLLTARIHDQSKVILPILFTCSASTYDKETERLLHLLSTDNITLTGMRFFSITRNFLLAVAGAIVTYEVVLLQFNVAMNK